ncbi:MAG: 2OG-Fe(II) oxygenase family protein [Proteobacteria bacterium]|nr:2OG-Fe(II) oxygenase family protein [Pseudomonadota bacterium]
MFPTFVWQAELEPAIHRRINRTIAAKLDEIRRPAPALEPGQAWQSAQDLHTLDEFRELVSCVDEAAATVLDYLKIGGDAIEITACWANVSAPGAAHRTHSHPNNFLSGVYYVQTRAGADTINFHDPRPQTGIIRPPATELTAENADQVVVTVKDGTLLLFPAWLQHSVDANRSDRERTSVSFNIMFTSYTERMSKPLW